MARLGFGWAQSVEQRRQCRGGIADQSDRCVDPAGDLLGVDVDAYHRPVERQGAATVVEVGVAEFGAHQHHGIGRLHRLLRGWEPQAGIGVARVIAGQHALCIAREHHHRVESVGDLFDLGCSAQ